jgi:hypothetical protein
MVSPAAMTPPATWEEGYQGDDKKGFLETHLDLDSCKVIIRLTVLGLKMRTCPFANEGGGSQSQ